MTIEEGNRIIAVFMGATIAYSPKFDEWSFNDGGGDLSFGSVHYDSSWDWLMPVVEKIESIKDEYHGYFGVYISSNSCTIQATNFRPDRRIPDPPHYFADWTLYTKIMSTWTAVVYFIQWYNQTIKQ